MLFDRVGGVAIFSSAHTTGPTLATFFGLMVFTINLDDQPQCNTAKVNRVRRNRIFTTKFLVPALSITDELPDCVRKLIGPPALVSCERDYIRMALRSTW